ncbi:iron complex transport system ATP-binding protein [Aequitasia blattaphilus]|uniref:ABC transporter ATP-binding protein n=1 Tax=Aequitasia blattaphilus TaxID=2949332 RepID=A0ABT1ED66_9FIRM|nr:ABC transporter ATP-binding protein [Aequitasia blattaphilus]MCP1103614.1 ABC transporter ATP-binding protein [Aequitasia blattaphilus]MCR8616254.1 ABC transporter ATP-binding protein [Aequitasia blattaphilus]
MDNKQIEVKNLKVGYDEITVMEEMNLAIPKGRISIIIGPNGCGKSTLLKTISRILKPAEGEVLLDGKSIARRAPKEVAKRMAVLPQSPTAPGDLLVKELVGYGRFPYQKPMSGFSKEDIEIVNWAMEATGISEFANRSVAALSGGQRQRVWIAMALAQKTDILVLDEPTTYLDMANQLEILTLLKRMNHEMSITILIVMHELNNAIKFADYIVGMKSGKLLFNGIPKEVITEKNLRDLFDIEASIQMDETNTFPICTNYELIEGC